MASADGVTVEYFATDVLCMAVWQTDEIEDSDVLAFLNSIAGFENIEYMQEGEIPGFTFAEPDRTLKFYYFHWPDQPIHSDARQVFQILYTIYQSPPGVFHSAAGGTLELVSISPNWIYGGAQGHFGGGGPGTDPVPVPPGKVPQPGDPNLYRADTMKLLQNTSRITAPKQGSTEASVEVYILDTAWTPEKLSQRAADFPENALLNELATSSRFQIHLPAETSLRLADESHSDGWALINHTYHNDLQEYYDLRDHGLFIAGLIYQLSQCANIHIVQTLNKWCACSLQSLIDALHFVSRKKISGIPTIINCSIVISFASNAEFFDYLRSLLEDETLNQNELKSFLEWLTQPAQVAFDFFALSSAEIKILAASGNDSIEEAENNKADARYPAYHNNVIGVAALNKNGDPAFYSNKPDEPVEAGLWIFGGNAEDTLSRNGMYPAQVGNGMLGLYIAPDFPDGTPNNSGWAYWAGTSFATGMASGLYAELACRLLLTLDEVEALTVNQKLGNVIAHRVKQ